VQQQQQHKQQQQQHEQQQPKQPQQEPEAEKSSKVVTSSRPQRRSVSRTSPTKASEDEARTPNFEAASDELANEKAREGQLPFVRWLMETGFVRSAAPVCCNAEAVLKADDGCADGVAWVCETCSRGHSVRAGSIFAKSTEESLCWIVRLILCWSDNVRSQFADFVYKFYARGQFYVCSAENLVFFLKKPMLRSKLLW
jgi:hypothetical protein